jgi:UDP-2,3-diacylglucosamine hydrolase
MPSLSCQSALLCSDVHLSDDTPLLADAFLAWLHQRCLIDTTRPQWLLILGDLFDAWIGDDLLSADDSNSIGIRISNALAALSQAGIRIGLMHGNRDFLLARDFAGRVHAELLNDPTLLVVEHGPRIALTHGDALCTDDIDYQRFRNQVRTRAWQTAFLAKPLAERNAAARQMRADSTLEKSGKAMAIMDVNEAAANDLIQQMKADMLLHGHTHRPGCSQLSEGRQRWVLPDWQTDTSGSLTRGGGLWVDASGVRVLG